MILYLFLPHMAWKSSNTFLLPHILFAILLVKDLSLKYYGKNIMSFVKLFNDDDDGKW